MSFNWWNLLPRWVQDVLAKIPSPVIEFASGWVTVALAVGLQWVLAHIGGGPVAPMHGLGASIVLVLWVHLLSLAYEMFIDVNGLEWKDLAQRELGILPALALWIWVL